MSQYPSHPGDAERTHDGRDPYTGTDPLAGAPSADPLSPHADPMAERPRRRGGLFPIPHRTYRTKRGSSVTVGGCCLPIPLGFGLLVAAGGYAAHQVLSSSPVA
ncbi:hypothetical protein [Kytococcus sedentarius]|uniref:hypothetical protein n=1 Tax=Kytococcus sedentarius TaxID=1276 RepID=UPI0035BC5F09